MEESIYMVNKFATDLERYTRKSLLKFIFRESEEKGATIFEDAHIFNYLARWDTHTKFVRVFVASRALL